MADLTEIQTPLDGTAARSAETVATTIDCDQGEHVAGYGDNNLRAALDALEAVLGDEGASDTVASRPEGGTNAEIPAGLVAHAESICRSPWVAQRVLDVAAGTVLRRIRNNTEGSRRARWAKRWEPENREATKRWLGQVRDRVVRVAHLSAAACHDAPRSLSEADWRAGASGVLVIDEPAPSLTSFGSVAYLEQTPVKLLRWVHETWLSHRRNLEAPINDVGTDRKVKPRLWDLTAGSGTGSDYFGAHCGCDIVSSDTVIVPQTGVALGDCRYVGATPGHRGTRTAFRQPGLVITEPDIVLFDPPSRGFPGHTQVYGERQLPEDLASLEREPWLFAVADVTARATRFLADGGFVSLLFRSGARVCGEIVRDPTLLDDFKAVLGDRARIVHEMPLAYRSVRNQTSLGPARVPAVHLLVTRS